MKMPKIYFETQPNPRPSPYELGPITCDGCRCQTSMYLIIGTKDTEFNICSGCLTVGIEKIQKAILDSFNPK